MAGATDATDATETTETLITQRPGHQVGTPDMRRRVEELADAAGISVDTIRFYQKRRLLDPPEREGRVGWYSQHHLERLQQIRRLQRDGLNLALIGRVLRGELRDTDAPLAAAVAAAADTGAGAEREPTLTLGELAERAGVPEPLLAEVAERGLLVTRSAEDGTGYTESDVAAVRAGVTLLDHGLPLDRLLELARAHHEATQDIAEQAIEMFDEYIRRPLMADDTPGEERAEALVASFDAVLPAVTALVEHHFRRVLLRSAQRHLGADETESVGAGEHGRGAPGGRTERS